MPLKEVTKQRYQRGRCRELLARRLDIAIELDDVAFQRAVPPEAEGVAVGINQVRQGPELLLLLPIVPILETPRIGALAGRLDLDEAHQSVVEGYSVVGTRLEVGKRKFRPPAQQN